MSKLRCPWCNCECDYYIQRVPGMPYGSPPAQDSPVQEMDYENVKCLCPSCKGTFIAVPKIERLGYDMMIQTIWKDTNGEDNVDWDMDSFDIDKLREEYLEQLGYGEKKRFSLPSGGFSLPPSSDKFALPPASSKFSLSNLRRRRR